MKKVLIITYYWPPAGGSGVQRCLKFTKYLKQFGWTPIVYTVKDGEFPVTDNSLLKDVPSDVDVIRSDIWEPYHLYKRFTGRKTEKVGVGFITQKSKETLTQKLSVWIRGNFFIPDARKFWIKPSIKFLSKYIKEQGIDTVITSGPPHSAHMIGLGLKKKLGINWVADFRDPWTEVYYYSSFRLSKWADRKHHRMEKDVLDHADHVIVVGRQMKESFEKISQTPISVITNGYDEDDYSTAKVDLDKEFSIVSIGMFMNNQDPVILWKVLQKMINTNKQFKNDLRIRLVGKADSTVLNSIKEHELWDNLEQVDYVPHSQAIEFQKKAQVLLLAINRIYNAEYMLTGKLFEYLAANRPILCIGPQNGDAGNIVEETQSGITIEFDDEVKLTETLNQFYNSYKEKSLNIDGSGISTYSRRMLTKKLIKVIEDI